VATKQRPAASRRRPPAKAAPSPVRAALSGQAAELTGVVLVVAGVLAGLGIYADLTGPAGRVVSDAAGSLLGVGRYVLPPVLLWFGARLVLGRTDRTTARVALGTTLLLLAVGGLWHLWAAPGPGAAVAELRPAGGLVGMVAAEPLRSALATGGAVVVLLVGLVGGVLLVTGTPVRVAAERTAATLRPVGHATVEGSRRARMAAAERRDRRADRRAEARAAAEEDAARRAAEPESDPATADPVESDPTTADLGRVDVIGADPDGGDLTAVGLRALARDVAGDGDDPDPTVARGDRTEAIEVHVPLADLLDGDDDGDGGFDLDDRDVDDRDLDGLDDLGDPADADRVGPGGDVAPAREWSLPPLALLERSKAQEVDRRLVEQAGRTLEHALAAHGVETRLIGMTVGPTVTRFELELGPGVKVARVTSLNRDIAYAMASPDVRILAPIPGRSAIGVEVPNSQRQLVAVGDILASDDARRATHPLEVAVGRDIAGRAVLANLAEMPHILIAGATGSGKSSCINSLITSILVRSTPEQVRLILIDPKRVELGQYNGLPHLLTAVVVDPKKAANALSWAVKEMERRYELLFECGTRDITGYNAAVERGDLVSDDEDVEFEALPFIVVVVDELNDLMMVAARDVEDSICRLAQMARAVGIHLVIATQRPSVNVITGVIKANVPARLAFAVSSLADSRVILDQGGAERLVGQGDMLLLGASSSTPNRIQGSWVGEAEVRKVVAHWKRQSPSPEYVPGVEGDDAADPMLDLGGTPADDDDEALLWQAMELVVRSQLGSTSMLQRKLRVGFARAGRLMDLLEQRGVVGPSEGSKARAVLMTPDELDDLLESKAG
jgi:S-DNA-T family DNA segregation ATPase FtsK/SpoIIIE